MRLSNFIPLLALSLHVSAAAVPGTNDLALQGFGVDANRIPRDGTTCTPFQPQSPGVVTPPAPVVTPPAPVVTPPAPVVTPPAPGVITDCHGQPLEICLSQTLPQNLQDRSGSGAGGAPLVANVHAGLGGRDLAADIRKALNGLIDPTKIPELEGLREEFQAAAAAAAAARDGAGAGGANLERRGAAGAGDGDGDVDAQMERVRRSRIFGNGSGLGRRDGDIN